MVSNPEKEIRFTRSQQARNYAVLGAILISVAATLLATVIWGKGSSVHPLAAVPFLLLAAGVFWLSFHCARHAFIILSPVGIEFFPFVKPSQNFRVWAWSEFHHAEIIGSQLYLHFNSEETGGAVISLRPLAARSRELLDVAIEGRMDERFADDED